MAHEHAYLICEDKCLVESRPVKKATVTLAVAGWSNNSQTVSVSGMTADCMAIVCPDSSSMNTWVDCGVKATSQANGTLTFTCTVTPNSAITVGIQMIF